MLLVLEVNALYMFWHPECHSQSFASQILGQLIEQFEIQVQLFVLLPGDEGGIQLDGQHIERSLQFVLHGDALAQRWLELQGPRAHQLVEVNGLVDLGDTYLVPVLH